MKKISKFTCILAIIISCFGLVGCSGFTRIEDKSGNVLYEDTTYIDESNFGTYFNEIKGNIRLAKLEIPVSEIVPGVSSEGIIYITVSNEDKFYFDETEVELHGELKASEM